MGAKAQGKILLYTEVRICLPLKQKGKQGV
jgi:hypothetical protein